MVTEQPIRIRREMAACYSNHHLVSKLFVLVSAVALLTVSALAGQPGRSDVRDDWPQWRGPAVEGSAATDLSRRVVSDRAHRLEDRDPRPGGTRRPSYGVTACF
jgi:hypothetical protein